MKYLLATISLLAVTATPALADTSKANIKDHYKVVIEQTPYNVEVCKDVRLQKSGTNTEGAIIGGKQKPNQGGNTERRCTVETRYKELSREVYSHSTVTFLSEGKHYTLKFQR